MTSIEQIEAWLKQVKELDEKASPGPWGYCYDGSSDWSLGLKKDPQNDRICTANERVEFNPPNNLKLIAHSRTALPAAAKAIEFLMQELNNEDFDVDWVRDKVAQLLNPNPGLKDHEKEGG